MTQFIDEFIAQYSLQFYIFQVFTVIVLMAYGLMLVYAIRMGRVSLTDVLVAFPSALAVYSLTGYFLLSFGIPFNRATMLVFMGLILLAAFAVFITRRGKILLTGRTLLITAGVVTALALISVSGIFKVSVTNDSMYYFTEYSRALINYGRLSNHLDMFLTDAAQGFAILGTMPFFFGFDELFGVQTFLNIDFVMLFAYAAYDISCDKLGKKRAYIIAGLSVLMLISSMPIVIMAGWFMANTFFMEFMFIVVYLAYKYEGRAFSEEAPEYKYSDVIILSILVTGLSILRMEGALIAGFIVLCIMMLNYRNKDIAFFMVCPMLILQSAYLFRIFKILTLYAGFQFMTEEKALILIAFLLVIIFYALIIRGRFFLKLQKYYSFLLVAGLLLLNIAVLVYDSGDYITNFKAFIGNVIGSSGWGLFASFVIGILIIIPKKSMRINYFDITMVCYVLLTIVACWARGDDLVVSFGDSGNRMLIQAVPLIVFALAIKLSDALEYMQEKE